MDLGCEYMGLGLWILVRYVYVGLWVCVCRYWMDGSHESWKCMCLNSYNSFYVLHLYMCVCACMCVCVLVSHSCAIP